MKVDNSDYHKISFGMFTSLFDRYTNNLGWLSIPLIIYNVIVHTVKYLPFLSEHILRMTILAFIGFFIGAAVVMYLDWKYVFKSERQFQYNKMEFFEDHYNEIKSAIQMKREAILRNKGLCVNAQ
jgi:hypothetical protein